MHWFSSLKSLSLSQLVYCFEIMFFANQIILINLFEFIYMAIRLQKVIIILLFVFPLTTTNFPIMLFEQVTIIYVSYYESIKQCCTPHFFMFFLLAIRILPILLFRFVLGNKSHEIPLCIMTFLCDFTPLAFRLFQDLLHLFLRLQL